MSAASGSVVPTTGRGQEQVAACLLEHGADVLGRVHVVPGVVGPDAADAVAQALAGQPYPDFSPNEFMSHGWHGRASIFDR